MSYRIAIVGAGPGGFYAAEALLRAPLPIEVDMIDRLPVPYGLVRYGVAPDHPKLKQVTAVFDRIAALPGFRFIGGVEVGRDVSMEALRAGYHAIIVATGASIGRRMGVPGEDLPGSHAASDFVGWYNGHPDQQDCRFDLSAECAVVVGHGNVALDVARILLKGVDELRHTDIAAHALDTLAASRVREVHVVGRRGPAQTRFSAKELHEFGMLAHCEPMLAAADLSADSFVAPANADPDTRAAIGMLEAFARNTGAQPRRCVFRFHLEPLAIEGDARVQRMQFARADAKPVAIDCGLVFSSIGRQSARVPGVPYDNAHGVHANHGGRITEGGVIVPGLYASGWSKRGPRGTIGTNRACGVETAQAVLDDLPALGTRVLSPVSALAQGIDFAAWQRIDQTEIARGRAAGKPREKLVSIDRMRAAASEAHEESAAC
ncbi:FAD-dependent oxidoreductase [Ralstonia solanacearum]|uniref:Pyridine nucleotide-disulfide oxidoreductase n=1 Tax=Ralstonia solanacearum TaxID=305 RepID=A0AAD0S7E4_RALSL|nr:FAD-dependent oxidoreductase [Ralstonia solanacearum]AXV82391.1 pyridine nucleotide-disulfide oxidoreductase [Ralstonia solanacearum]AXW53515.1 pyridine nucleotide-disulfide oxidoreductase [Ralstonia solanacearum]CBJ52006.1 putative Ferredoxin--NADP(+) reductase, adrenodoxin reductase [Ralstonia solanacearum PSI07]